MRPLLILEKRFQTMYCPNGEIPLVSVYKSFDRPGLAQLVEGLSHRYSESTSSNTNSNLTSATGCRDRTGGKPAAKRLARVAPEVDLRECTLCSPLQCE